jgi:putative FmdB family regulatory protein
MAVKISRGGHSMPIYSYTCRECKKSFTQQMTITEYEKGRAVCPKCNSKKVEQKVAAFFAVSAKKS